ncbi:membrane protein insertase YidC [Paenibacillus sp. GCM10023250]|uniref:membrane protein insertase YidC n=1 Tax=Paenibacillus sp. GCM10023250 TaxID=3252648 RepID=UPI003611FAF3
MSSTYAQIAVFHDYFVSPFTWLIDHFAGWFDGNFGLALVAITVLVRLALMPFMVNQYKRQQAMRRKLAAMQPELEAVKRKYAASAAPDKQRKQTEETMAVYAKHGYSPLNAGCLPMLLQIPILSGLYFAIRSNPELAHHTFLWFQLGSPDPVLPFVAAGIYLIQARLAQAAQPPMNGAKGMGLLLYLSPVMMGVFSFTAPAALPLYWSVGGLVMIAQTWISKRLYPQDDTGAAVGTA